MVVSLLSLLGRWELGRSFWCCLDNWEMCPPLSVSLSLSLPKRLKEYPEKCFFSPLWAEWERETCVAKCGLDAFVERKRRREEGILEWFSAELALLRDEVSQTKAKKFSLIISGQNWPPAQGIAIYIRCHRHGRSVNFSLFFLVASGQVKSDLSLQFLLDGWQIRFSSACPAQPDSLFCQGPFWSPWVSAGGRYSLNNWPAKEPCKSGIKYTRWKCKKMYRFTEARGTHFVP